MESTSKRPRTAHVRSPENIAALRVAIQRSLNKSTRQAAREMGISRCSVLRILHSGLKLLSYKITVLHKLFNQNKQIRLEYALWAEGKDEIFFNTWFSDEAYFHLNGTVNKQNVHFWGKEKPQKSRKKMGKNVNLGSSIQPWCNRTSFFNETVNAAQYRIMLENEFVPLLLATNLPRNTQ